MARLSTDMDSPRVSIVLPTFNGAKYLSRSLESCLEQSYEDLEVIVVVDVSTDETPQILDAVKDPRLRIVRRRENRGLPESLNEGFSLAQGEFLSWTSDDNAYRPNAIATMFGLFERHPEVGLVYASYDTIDGEGRIVDRYCAEPPEALLRFNAVGACFLYRRAVQECVGEYDPSYRLIEDYHYWLRARQCAQFRAIAEPLYEYRHHDASLTARCDLLDREQMALEMKRDLGLVQGRVLRKEMARIDIARAFDRFQTGRTPEVPRLVLRALFRDPTLLRDRGVLSIFARATVGLPASNGG